MKNFKKYTFGLGLALAALTTACEDQSSEVTSMEHDRLFAPHGIEAKVFDDINARISWAINSEASTYDIEVFEDDSLTFEGTPIQTFTGLTAQDMPYDISGLMGDTQYSVRLKAKSDNMPESKWNGIYFKTSPEQLLASITDDELTYSSVTISWEEGKKVTGAIVTPGDIQKEFTADELAACKATVEGLAGNTEYSIKLLNGTKNCGERTFNTLIDPATALVVPDSYATLQEALAASVADSKKLILIKAGTYVEEELSVETDVEIVGERTTDRPVIKGANFQLNGGSIIMRNIIIDGDGTSNHAFDYKTAGDYTALEVENCIIRNFGKGLFYLNTTSLVESITFDNCLINKVECSGSDFMDTRKGAYKTLTFTNNTVWESCAERDFVRYDNKATDFPGITSVINVSNNTLVGISNSTSRRIMYVRFDDKSTDDKEHSIIFKDNLVTDTEGYFSKQSETDESPECNNNNYYNAKNAGTILVKVSDANTAIFTDAGTTMDPKFEDAANGDFTITNKDLKINKVGDPRWLD